MNAGGGRIKGVLAASVALVVCTAVAARKTAMPMS